MGLCQVGAWGCFDEFNRLEERMLSAVSQQVQTIQLSLREGSNDPCKLQDSAFPDMTRQKCCDVIRSMTI